MLPTFAALTIWCLIGSTVIIVGADVCVHKLDSMDQSMLPIRHNGYSKLRRSGIFSADIRRMDYCAGLRIYVVISLYFTWYGHKNLVNTVLTAAVSDLAL